MKHPNFNRLGPKPDSNLLIIGGCGGIGHALVNACIDTGQSVVVMDLERSFNAVTLPESVQTIPIDLRDEAAIQTAFAAYKTRFAAPDHVAFASGYTSALAQVKTLDSAILDDVMGGNLRGPVLAAKQAAILMDSGSFVFLSTAIAQVGAPGYGPYSMAKAGVNALTRILASELAPQIRVNGVAPGPVDTPFIHGGMGRDIDTLETSGPPKRFDLAKFEAMTPLGRIANADDIVGPILFLMSDAARFVTGQVLHVNGGGFMRD